MKLSQTKFKEIKYKKKKKKKKKKKEEEDDLVNQLTIFFSHRQLRKISHRFNLAGSN
jgi:hypothetical protein